MWWHVLRVKPTDDEKTVKKAYAAIIKQVNQDNEIEMFTKVHHAFREALKDIKLRAKALECLLEQEQGQGQAQEQAQQQQEQLQDASGTKKNISKNYLDELASIYEDPERRFKKDWWKNLFDCMSFNEEAEFHECYANFFNEHAYLTAEVWELIESYYSLKRHKDFKWQALIHGEFSIREEEIIAMSCEQSVFYVESKIKIFYYILEGLNDEAYDLLSALFFEHRHPDLNRWLMVVAIALDLKDDIDKAYDLMRNDGDNELLGVYYYSGYFMKKGDYHTSLKICESLNEAYRDKNIQGIIDQNNFFLYQQVTQNIETLPWLQLDVLPKKDKLLIQKGQSDKLIKQEQSSAKGRGWWKR
jgi:FtsZ-binding cell division protein ZapB